MKLLYSRRKKKSICAVEGFFVLFHARDVPSFCPPPPPNLAKRRGSCIPRSQRNCQFPLVGAAGGRDKEKMASINLFEC